MHVRMVVLCDDVVVSSSLEAVEAIMKVYGVFNVLSLRAVPALQTVCHTSSAVKLSVRTSINIL